MKKLIAVFLAAVCILSVCSCSGKNKDFTVIETPYADLRAPKEFKDNATWEVTGEDPYTLVFKLKKDGTRLFDIIFNGGGEVLMGTLIKDDVVTYIFFNYPTLDSTSPNYKEACEAQEAINDITNNLKQDYDFTVDTVKGIETDNSTFDIETSVATLKYPTRWKYNVQTTVTQLGVQFSNEGTPLFDIAFAECDGTLLGSYNGTPVYLVTHTPKNDTQAQMIEDANVILENLTADPNFTPNQA